jgi:two-component system, NarL family, sensor histidine kinase UhpB
MHLMRNRLLGLPIIYKVLVANTAIVVIGAVGGTWLTIGIARSAPAVGHYELLAAFAGVGVLASVAVNYLVLRAALAPLTALEATVSEVRNGNVDARAPRSAFTDPAFEQLRETLNSMLDALATYRRRLRGLSSQVITAQEEERKRISRELHDETAQALTSLLVRLRLLQGARDLDEVRAGASELRELTARTLEEVRKLAVELRPTTLDHLGLVAALEWYCREHAQRLDAVVEFHSEGLAGRLQPEVELVIYRVVQEALTNIVRHAGAGRVEIGLLFRDDAVEVEVRDNGIGFDVGEATSTRERGLGLFGMRERVELIGGTFSIESQPREGTCINVRVPVTTWGDAFAPEGAEDRPVPV